MAKDIIHPAVRKAIENDGFLITGDPFGIDLIDDGTKFHVDLAAQRKSGRTKKSEKIIAIEVKSFAGTSVLNAFHEALGQFLNYRDAIRENKLSVKLFLAVSEDGWERLNSLNFVARRIKQYHLKFVIVDIHEQKVVQWKNQ